MDKKRSGIFFQELPHSKPIQRFVVKQLERWLNKFQRKEAAYYRVEFNRLADRHMVGCHIEILAGGQVWRGSTYGRGIHQAFSQCLKNIA